MAAFSRENPSLRYIELLGYYRQMHETGDTANSISAENTFAGQSLPRHVNKIRELINKHSALTILDYGSGKGQSYRSQNIRANDGVVYPNIASLWNVQSIACYDPGYKLFQQLPSGKFDGVISTDVVEHCPKEDLAWIIEEIFGYASKFVFINAACYLAKKSLPNGENAHCTVEPPKWWSQQFHAALRNWPGLVGYGCYGIEDVNSDGEKNKKVEETQRNSQIFFL